MAIAWPALIGMSAGSIVMSVGSIFTLPFDHSQLLNGVSLVYNSFLLYGSLTFHQRALGVSQSIQSGKMVFFILMAFFIPLIVSNMMSCGVFQSAYPEHLKTQSEIKAFLRKEIDKFPSFVTPLFDSIVSHILREAIRFHGPAANFNVGMETGFIAMAIILTIVVLYFTEYIMIAYLRNRIIESDKKMAAQEEEKLMVQSA
ncbi:hypothetical protein CAEBREN_02035 [Caenorhabditis brenneri]|uniref:Uncharacterized protein n=1 Tax=Caenorhabditis brenneri TaxID=135651 RepID=G0NMD0_CAEBE|nr:hypothetical protein CAEBREN_02035 [Caenorhabditis brenneri]